MTDETVYHLPGVTPARIERVPVGRTHMRLPTLSVDELHRVLDTIDRARQQTHDQVGLDRVIDALDRVGRRWTRQDDPWRRRTLRLVPPITGYCESMVAEGLDHLFGQWRAERIRAWLDRELPDARAARAHAPRRIVQVMAGNVPGAGLNSLVAGLLLGAATLVKCASGEPVLPSLVLGSLDEVCPAVGSRCAAVWWRGGSEALERDAFAWADLVVGFGHDTSLAAMRARVPERTAWIGHGSKLSFGIIRADTLDNDTAADAGRLAACEAAWYDQQGCLSAQFYLVVDPDGAAARRVAEQIAHGMAEMERQWPRQPIPSGSAAAIQQIRGEYDMRDDGACCWASTDSTAWTVLYEPLARLVESPLWRTVPVVRVPSVVDAVALARPLAGRVQAVALHPAPAWDQTDRDALAQLEPSGVCALGDLQCPPLDWPEDNQRVLAQMGRACGTAS